MVTTPSTPAPSVTSVTDEATAVTHVINNLIATASADDQAAITAHFTTLSALLEYNDFTLIDSFTYTDASSADVHLNPITIINFKVAVSMHAYQCQISSYFG